MKRTLILLPLVALAACASPRERCIAGANRPVATLDGLIAQTRGNIDRGYGLVEVQDVRVLRRLCQGTNADNSTFSFPCEETETFTRNEPVALDMNAERAKLVQLEERRAQSARAAAAQVQQCIAVHPE